MMPAPRALRHLNWLTVVKHVVLAVVALGFLLPFIWVIVTGFKDQREFYSGHFFPQGRWHIENYLTALLQFELPRYYFNSLFITGSAVFVGLFLALFSAYAMFRLRFRFRNVVFVGFVLVMMLPPQLTLISQFLLFQQMQILYTPWALILPYIVGVLPLSVFILRGFFNELPIDLDHAARMDGATDTQIVFLVLLPLSVPALATAFILTFIQTWNEFLIASIFVRRDWYTIPVAISEINSVAASSGNEPLKFAAVVLSFLPLLILFLFMQRYFVRGLVSGGVKG